MVLPSGTLAPVASGRAIRRGVSWSEYEQLLDQIGDGSTRITFAQGSMEIMSPLPEHEQIKRAISRLIETATFEAGVPLRCFGSTTFRRADRQAGLEPDECYYIANETKVRGMKRFDPAIHPAPDLAVEVDLLSRSIAREPIYAALGVPELWRVQEGRVHAHVLQSDGTYTESPTSMALPFLRTTEVGEFLDQMLRDEQNAVLREFSRWVRKQIGA